MKFIFDIQRFDGTIDSGDVTISEGGTYTIASGYAGTITVATTAAVTLDGSGAGNLTAAQIVTGSNVVDLTINALKISNADLSPLRFGSGGGALTLTGENVLSTGNYYAAAVNIGGGVTINGTGSLSATATGYGAGIGTDYGETSTATLTIAGGTVTSSANYGAGIGGGFMSTIGTVSVTGGTVNAISSLGAGLGSGAGSSDNTGAISITGGTVNATARDGAGIGSGFDGAAGNVSIGGNSVVNATSTNYGAGIGSGSTFGNTSRVGAIAIGGAANVTATAAQYGAGIGTGYARYNGTTSAGNISVTDDANVSAVSQLNGLGLGAGHADDTATSSVGSISLSGDTATTPKSAVIIDNSNTTRTVTINGSTLSGSRLTFVDGTQSNPTSTVDNTTVVTVSDNVTGVTNVGKVEGSDDYIYLGGIGVISDYAGVELGGVETTTVTVVDEETGEETEVTETVGAVETTGAKIRYATDCRGFEFDGYTLAINSSTGALIVQDCKDKIIAVADVDGNTTAYVYSPSDGGIVYGNALSSPEVIVGADTGANIIFAGNGGSTTWGGFGDGNDTLVGGAGHDEFIYIDGTGTDVVSNYGNEDLIKVGGTVEGVNLFGDFALNFANGTLVVADAQDKLITVTDGAGNVGGQAYYASSAGVINGAAMQGVGVIVGGAFGDNFIIAGNGGSILWGNFGGVDTLIGGGGHDDFVYTPGSGVVFVQNANTFDTVNLFGMTADQVAGVVVTPTDTTLTFTDGGALNVQGFGVRYQLDGGTYVADLYTQSLAPVSA